MTSFLAFAGGSYGYVRCALGPFNGYLVGFCESIEYVLYVSAAVVVFGDLVTSMTGAHEEYAPLYWLIFFVISLSVIIPGGPVFWQFSNIQAFAALFLILIYCFGGMSEVNLAKYDSGFIGGGDDFMLFYPLAAWFYVGVEAMTLTCEDIKDAGKQVPWAIMGCVATLFCTCIMIYFVTCSLAPGSLLVGEATFPLDAGFMDVFGVNSMTAAYLSLPGIFSTGYGFMFAYGRQLYSMSKSGLFPKLLSATYGKYDTPHMALIIGSLISYLVLLILYYTVPNFGGKLFNICMLGSCSVYISLARAYIVCYDRYSNMERHFKSPLGKWAAYWTMAVFSLMIVALAFFQQDDYLSITVFIIFVVIAVIYYYTVAQKREFFSEEEQEKFMKAYILNANHKRKAHKSSSSSLGFLNKILPGSATAFTNNRKSSAVSISGSKQQHQSSERLHASNSKHASAHVSTGLSGGSSGLLARESIKEVSNERDAECEDQVQTQDLRNAESV